MNLALQMVSVLGALLILGAFVALQRGRCSSQDRAYLWANFAGAALLTIVAVRDRRLGFILLEGVWALVALQSLLAGVRRATRRP
ncbi:MAG TPA: hypothetical protein VGA37_17680 [Gemmatimonadales bacterium]